MTVTTLTVMEAWHMKCFLLLFTGLLLLSVARGQGRVATSEHSLFTVTMAQPALDRETCIAFLKEYVEQNPDEKRDVFADVTSALGFTRKDMNKVCENIVVQVILKDGNHATVLIDRSL